MKRDLGARQGDSPSSVSQARREFWYHRTKGMFYVLVTRSGGSIYTSIGHGYSGRSEGKNNPRWEKVAGKGPIPKGEWKVGQAYASRRLGALAIPLTAEPSTMTFGRSAFLIHGDSRLHPGQASSGCIILPWVARSRIARQPGAVLVVSDEPPPLV